MILTIDTDDGQVLSRLVGAYEDQISATTDAMRTALEAVLS